MHHFNYSHGVSGPTAITEGPESGSQDGKSGAKAGQGIWKSTQKGVKTPVWDPDKRGPGTNETVEKRGKAKQ